MKTDINIVAKRLLPLERQP